MIDIIIPVYNTPINDLIRCFKSIKNQTYTNYLVYIIDDGSNNNTKEFLDNYSKQNKQFIIKHINNKGVSHARNIGIDISNNEYLVFIDSDDTINENFLKEAYQIIEENNLDLLIGGYNEIKDNKIIKTRKCLEGLHIYDKNNKIRLLEKLLSGKTNNYNKEIDDCPTGRIYTRIFKRSSLKGLRFNENIKISEDTLFMIYYVKQALKIGIIDKIWYNYYKNNYSISNATKKNILINNINDFIKEIKKLLEKEENKELINSYKTRIEKANNYINELKNAN